AVLAVPDSGWRKPAGRKARAFVDLVSRPDGVTTFERIVAEGQGMELAATGTVYKGKVTRLQASTLRLDGLYDGSAEVEQGERGLEAKLAGRYLDARPVLKRAQREAGKAGASDGATPSSPMQLDADIARVRLSEDGYLKDARV